MDEMQVGDVVMLVGVMLKNEPVLILEIKGTEAKVGTLRGHIPEDVVDLRRLRCIDYYSMETDIITEKLQCYYRMTPEYNFTKGDFVYYYDFPYGISNAEQHFGRVIEVSDDKLRLFDEAERDHTTVYRNCCFIAVRGKYKNRSILLHRDLDSAREEIASLKQQIDELRNEMKLIPAIGGELYREAMERLYETTKEIEPK